MKHGSLFSGIGGFDLAAEWMGWENVFHCENNKFGQKILKYYWPNAISYGDIIETDFTIYRGNINILTGGFPCQPYSQAGKRGGDNDERHLWPEMLRAIREIQSEWIVGENVPGLINWNRGLVFDKIQADLEASGYKVIPFILPAVGINAPHKRERLWIIAHSDSNRLEGRMYSEKPKKPKQLSTTLPSWYIGKEWHNNIPKSAVFSRNDDVSFKLDGITVSKWRLESIKSYGNAIVPGIALQIFKAIEEYKLKTH